MVQGWIIHPHYQNIIDSCVFACDCSDVWRITDRTKLYSAREGVAFRCGECGDHLWALLIAMRLDWGVSGWSWLRARQEGIADTVGTDNEVHYGIPDHAALQDSIICHPSHFRLGFRRTRLQALEYRDSWKLADAIASGRSLIVRKPIVMLCCPVAIIESLDSGVV